MGTIKGAAPVSNPAAGDPYQPASDYLDLAMRAAMRADSADPSGYRWRDAILAVGIVQMGLPTPRTYAGTSPLTCVELTKAARDAFAALPTDQRAVDHVLHVAYVQDAMRAVQAAAADEASGA
jgi:hypothetical protein